MRLVDCGCLRCACLPKWLAGWLHIQIPYLVLESYIPNSLCPALTIPRLRVAAQQYTNYLVDLAYPWIKVLISIILNVVIVGANTYSDTFDNIPLIDSIFIVEPFPDDILLCLICRVGRDSTSRISDLAASESLGTPKLFVST